MSVFKDIPYGYDVPADSIYDIPGLILEDMCLPDLSPLKVARKVLEFDKSVNGPDLFGAIFHECTYLVDTLKVLKNRLPINIAALIEETIFGVNSEIERGINIIDGTVEKNLTRLSRINFSNSDYDTTIEFDLLTSQDKAINWVTLARDPVVSIANGVEVVKPKIHTDFDNSNIDIITIENLHNICKEDWDPILEAKCEDFFIDKDTGDLILIVDDPEDGVVEMRFEEIETNDASIHCFAQGDAFGINYIA